MAKAARYASVQASRDGKGDCVSSRYDFSKLVGSARKTTRGSVSNASYVFQAFRWFWTKAPMIFGFVRWRSSAICVIRQNATVNSDCASNHAFALEWCKWSEKASANQTLASANLIT